MTNAVQYQFRKRKTEFNPCPGIKGVIDVTVAPDPPISGQPATYTVSGTLSDDITAGRTVVGIGYGDLERTIGELYFQSFTESYKAGEPFTITVKDAPTPRLPEAFSIEIGVVVPIWVPGQPYEIYGCAIAAVYPPKCLYQ
ncbi:hypothetical protein RhiirA5_501614 [Rhizophagus irregularis]|uniref:MD-2-related lipid-recognition domain-containing protein n=1 Tax=Rhizophagus irregularis TaxID=588596 RepID=A0A2N0S900_9GLOM|nr:hypothetical protein RhiirA5_501614 [Rhizophagus irregularis]PKC72036.1 hypothetical protein RhiirA1_531521 [Rhizophagus irregularis]CAB5216789.1 unnamed protein product [Rhizophagus irregularis]